MTTIAPNMADLRVRVISAVVMLVAAVTALWLGDWAWMAFVALVAVGVLLEWSSLVLKFEKLPVLRSAWIAAGIVYIGVAAITLVALRWGGGGANAAATVVGVVAAVDIGAFFFGRAIGGPKIAPRISPAKTWAGLGGGALGASLTLALFWHNGALEWTAGTVLLLLAGGIAVAVIAQVGDFFESWMKRRAGVKDSGDLLPGHGGLFDRVDGLIAVCFALGLTATVVSVSSLVDGGALLLSPA